MSVVDSNLEPRLILGCFGTWIDRDVVRKRGGNFPFEHNNRTLMWNKITKERLPGRGGLSLIPFEPLSGLSVSENTTDPATVTNSHAARQQAATNCSSAQTIWSRIFMHCCLHSTLSVHSPSLPVLHSRFCMRRCFLSTASNIWEMC